MNEIDYISNYESKFYRSAIPHIRPTTIVAVAFKNRDSGVNCFGFSDDVDATIPAICEIIIVSTPAWLNHPPATFTITLVR
ncbi:unnamed protein product [Lactuca virosa]|uniref:Uncharacterized protein n=1 Tax=Lactuca virosa TaxID=75947 RepID=A0AAU9NN29_9ASTR|nr:unnamed protein product [Lactuca virosa]